MTTHLLWHCSTALSYYNCCCITTILSYATPFTTSLGIAQQLQLITRPLVPFHFSLASQIPLLCATPWLYYLVLQGNFYFITQPSLLHHLILYRSFAQLQDFSFCPTESYITYQLYSATKTPWSYHLVLRSIISDPLFAFAEHLHFARHAYSSHPQRSLKKTHISTSYSLTVSQPLSFNNDKLT